MEEEEEIGVCIGDRPPKQGPEPHTLGLLVGTWQGFFIFLSLFFHSWERVLPFSADFGRRKKKKKCFTTSL
jgi:hypothetical protein